MVTFPSQGSLAFDLSSLGFNSLMHLFSCHTVLLGRKQPSFSPHLAKTYTDTGCWCPGPSVSEQEGCLKLRPAVTEQAISIHHTLDQPSDTALLGGQIGPTFCCGPSSPLLGNLIGKSIVIYSSSLCLTGSSPSFWIFFLFSFQGFYFSSSSLVFCSYDGWRKGSCWPFSKIWKGVQLPLV